MDLAAIVEEIALEGLDGITLNALWQRLNERPNFPKGNLDHDSKKFIWQYLSGCMDMEFYTLPEPRAELIIFKYSDYIYKDCSCHLPADTPPDIYPLVPIDEKGIKGNCQHFLTRVNVTALVRDGNGQCLCQLDEVTDKWGQSFVIVASQQQRNLVLFGYSFNPLGLSKDVYCTLECIGRGRTEGELTACKYNRGLSWSRTTTSPKTTLFSTIKLLVHFGLVTKQPFTVRYESSHGISQVRLVHLRRFSLMSSACYRTMVKEISDYLMSKPNYMAELKDVVKTVGTTNKQFKKMRKRFKGYLLSEIVPYRTMYPDSQTSEWKTKLGIERSIRMVKLLKPYNTNDTAIDDSDDDSGDDEDDSFFNKNEEDDDDEEEEEKPDEAETDLKKSDKSAVGNPLYNHSLLSQIVNLLSQSGERGMMQSEIKKKLNLNRLRIKYCLQELKKANAYAVVMKSIGKNNVGFLMSMEASEIDKVKREEKMNNDSIIDPMDLDESYTVEETVETSSETVQELDEKIAELNIIMTEEQVPLKKEGVAKKGNERKDLRKKCIIQYLAEKKAVHSAHILYMVISKHESKIGLKEQMCRKSFRKILLELRDEGKLYFINISSKNKPEKSIQQMVVESGVPADGVIVKKVLLSTPMNYMSMKFKNPVPSPISAAKTKQGGGKKKTPEKDKIVASTSATSDSAVATTPLKLGNETDNMISICDILDKCVLSSQAPEVDLNTCKLKKRGTLAKFEKAEVLHKYLFYLLYDYKGDPNGLTGLNVEPGSPTVYLDVSDWRRFLPPLKKHNAAILRDLSYPGTCMMGDFILHMPLEVFCHLVKNAMEVPGLQELLDDPIKKYYPITCIPPSVLIFLLIKRRYRGKIKDSLIMLCHMGLLSFGPLTYNRELEFISIFLHTQAMLLDTRKSLKCYIMSHCPEGEVFDTLRFHFQNMTEVERYWQDLKRICLLSNMGSSSTADIKGNHGNVSLLDAHKSKPIEEIVQEDWLPGDRRGAAGLDSSLFAHRSNNWNHDGNKRNLGVELMIQPSISTDIIKQRTVNKFTGVFQEFPEMKTLEVSLDSQNAKKKTVTKSPKGTDSTSPGQINNAEDVKPPSKRKPVAEKSTAKKAKVNPMISVPKRKAKKDRIPKPRVRKERFERKNIHDNTDKEAKKLLKKMRSSFTPLENGMILLFEVSSCLLLPRAAQCVHATFLRDLLHKLLQESKDKTASAIKGKALRLMKDKRFRCYLSCYISQALSDENIADKLRNLKRPQIFSQEMQNVFADLFYTLKDKFSCAVSHPVYLPSTITELNESFTVNKTDSYLYSSFKLTDMNVSVTNIQTIVVWELLECFLHLKSPVLSNSLFFTLSRYEDDVVKAAYNLLRTYGIIVKVKRSDKEKQLRLSSSSALLNSHKCMLRHTEALKSKISPDLFKNVVLHLESMKSVTTGRNQPSSTGDANEVAGEREPMEMAGSQSSQTPSSVAAKEAKVNEGLTYVDIDLNMFQGGVVMTLLTLLALKQCKIYVDIPDEMVKLDEEGHQKLSFKQPKSETARKRKLAALMESDEESSDDWAAEENPSPYQAQRRGKKTLTAKKRKGHDGCPLDGDKSESDKPRSDLNDSSSEVKTIHLESVTMSLRDMKISASSVLSNFTVWVGSGSLLTLARTYLIEKLDLLTSRCLLQRNFIVEPAKIKLALLSSDQVSSSQKKNETAGCSSSSSSEKVTSGNVQGASQVTGEDQIPNVFKLFDFNLYQKLIDHLEKCFYPDLDKDDMQTIIQSKIPVTDQERAKTLLEIIDQSDQAGISDEDLEKAMSVSLPHFKNVLHQMVMADIVFKVGILGRRFVSRRHVKVWMIEILKPQQTGAAETVDISDASNNTFLYICRLWRQFDGRLNPEGLKVILTRVMTYLMVHPGCPVVKICHVLNPDVLPATTMDAIDILETLGCIHFIRVEKLQPPTMFSRRSRILTISDDLPLSDSVTTIEVEMDGPMKLSYFLDTAFKHAAKLAGPQTGH